MSRLVPQPASHSASGRVKARMPVKPSSASIWSSTGRQRTDLLASRIGLPAARAVIAAALARSAARSATANGGSRCAVAALRRSSSGPAPWCSYGGAHTAVLIPWCSYCAGHSGASLVSWAYSAADIRPGGSDSPSASRTRNSQPDSYGSEFTRPGSVSTSPLTSATSPLTGE